MKGNPDPEIRRNPKNLSLASAIGQDLASDDSDEQQEAIDLLTQCVAQPPSIRKAEWIPRIQTNLRHIWWPPLSRIKQYDLVIALAEMGLSGGLENSSGIDQTQYCLARSLIESERYEEGLAAAKTYYDVCALENTGKAIQIVADALTKTRLKDDATIVARFKRQQAIFSQGAAGAATAPANLPTDLGPNVLSSIAVDAALYTDRVKEADARHPPASNFKDLMRAGNLYLLAGRYESAKKSFESAIEHAPTPKVAIEAVSGVARALRAGDGGVARANAYVLSMQSER